ncbi:MAG: hypothetical protein HY569_03295 [Candidatus Magasanikbacteria bacterium]|nr:hypothetical protein [Candidatus Magasanikbacteria bacterium]
MISQERSVDCLQSRSPALRGGQGEGLWITLPKNTENKPKNSFNEFLFMV